MSYFSLSRRLLRSISALRSASLPLLSQPVSSSFSSPSLLKPTENPLTRLAISSRLFCSRPMDLDEGQIPASIDYRSLLEEDEYHKLADTTINDLQEKFEEYGDNVQLDGFDIDYGNQVLTLKLGDLGTYVLNKQTPNRQIWLSSPVSIGIEKSLWREGRMMKREVDQVCKTKDQYLKKVKARGEAILTSEGEGTGPQKRPKASASRSWIGKMSQGRRLDALLNTPMAYIQQSQITGPKLTLVLSWFWSCNSQPWRRWRFESLTFDEWSIKI